MKNKPNKNTDQKQTTNTYIFNTWAVAWNVQFKSITTFDESKV